jgi:hypothetical protein
MPNPAMVSAAVAAIGATGLGTMYVVDKKQQPHTHNHESPLLQASKQQHGDGFTSQLAI